jgi:Cu+-exporting ATPase
MAVTAARIRPPTRQPAEDEIMVMPSTDDQPGDTHHAPPSTPRTDGLKDTVCCMAVSERSRHHVEHERRAYYFCSAKCKARFVAEPGRYARENVAPTAVDVAAQPAGTIYTCPMHPEIRQDHLGDCPKCGMALEPVMPTPGDDETPDLADFTRRFWWTLPFSVVVMVLAMAGHRLALFHRSSRPPSLSTGGWRCTSRPRR